MDDNLVRLSDVETELLKVTERYTVAHEANGMGRVVWSDNLISASCALNAVRSIPAVDAVEVRHGYWIDMADFESCSVCQSTHLKEFQSYYGKTTWIKTDYCPHCGARMDGRREDGDNNADR